MAEGRRERWIITAERVSERSAEEGGFLEVVSEFDGSREEAERAVEQAARTLAVGTFFQERRRLVYRQDDGSYLVRCTGRMGGRHARVLRLGRLVWDSTAQDAPAGGGPDGGGPDDAPGHCDHG
ncbi:hypothetical protein AB0953_13665 [Streptomyces sp. NPDC046866]|uniref:hypothetical protein n=1 Tax=Streptomyces sp. NPDC046866 TaxID=3154921 RepID=UPI0034516985